MTAYDGQPGSDALHATRRDYLTGFFFSVLLTAIPFWLVMTGVLHNKLATAGVILLFALAQIVVHMVCFLHMKARVEGGWALLALIFTVILVVIGISGSTWVLYHLQTNMMPGMQEMRQMP